MKKSSNDVQQAEALGRKAFKEGRKRVPAHDPELSKLIQSYKEPGESIPVLDAWLKGFDSELHSDVSISEEVKIEEPVINPETETQILRKFIPAGQRALIPVTDDYKVNKDRLIQQISQLPKIYGSDGMKGEAVAYLHIFYGSMDLYIMEFDGKDEFYYYGSAVQGGQFEGAYGSLENFWTYLPKLANLDYYWEPKKLKDIKDSRNPYYNEPVSETPKEEVHFSSLVNGKYKNQYEINKAIEKFLDQKEASKTAYTPEEINFIQQYAGYGGLGEYMGVDQESDLIKGTIFEYYTPDEIVKKCWGLAYKHGFTDGMVLEPSCATGRFIKYAPDQAQVKGYEINKYSCLIAQRSYPRALIMNNYFESEFYSGYKGRTLNKKYEGSFSLVIGNAPFGDYQGEYAGMGERDYSGATQIDHHFLLRGLDALKPGGILILIVNSRFMQSGHETVKSKIADRGNLVDAYRLPSGIFQNTEVTADIIVIKKKS